MTLNAFQQAFNTANPIESALNAVDLSIAAVLYPSRMRHDEIMCAAAVKDDGFTGGSRCHANLRPP